MVTDHALLSLVQWLSPAFPTGAFACSHGLEQVITDGQVHDSATLTNWLIEILTLGTGRQDAILLAHALDEDADHDALSDMARALAPSLERLTETLDQGAAFARTVAALTGQDRPPRPLPIAVGAAAGALGLPKAQVIALYLHAFASNLVSVAVRFVPLGQTDGQRVLATLHPLIGQIANDAAQASLDDIGTASFAADIAAMRHETLAVRIFRT
jgi:urease accessory protein